jgi:biopolymer transport protein ExbB/TolQ
MMSETIYTIFFTILLIIVILAVIWGCMLLSVILFKKAIYSVLDIFWEANAVNEKNARTPAELGFRRSFADELFRSGIRDYKPQALQLLIAYNIVMVTEDGRLYLCEEMLASKIPLLQTG